ncbi:MAG: hypothetical protein PF484_08515 [Bacteroidales bacterium]|jgi:putative transposase|nr:hypothetical protein [Bacteroidales bacterium]
MHLEKGYIYHIYNQGNNRQKIFVERENYLFFLRKLRTYILPYADVLVWCLMPNHFHIMVYVREVELKVGSLGVSLRHAETKITGHAETKITGHAETKITGHVETKITGHAETTISGHAQATRTFNSSIGIMLMSYTKAFNKQNSRTGKLFREATKAECVNCPKGLTPSFIIKESITQVNIQNPENQYPQLCFDYIHQNPVKAKLVKNVVNWEFSSAADYNNLRDGDLVNKIVAGEYVKF